MLKVVFLAGGDNASTRSSIARVCELDGVVPISVFIDTDRDGWRRRWRNLRRNVRREGISYVFHGVVREVDARLAAWADSVVPRAEADALLNRSFPLHSLEGLKRRYGFEVIEAGNLNSPGTVDRLRASGADLGVVLGTRILKRTTFEAPALGCINLHKGKVPEYRGMPPGFWELYDGAPSAGVTVHFVDDGLDTGDVVETAEIAIHVNETPESLRSKLDIAGAEALARAVAGIRNGTARRCPQPELGNKPRTRPTRLEQLELERRLPHWRRPRRGRRAIKNLIWLTIFWSGLFRMIRVMRRKHSRGAILLYHRVNDVSEDVLTASTRRFAEHLAAVRKYYRPQSTREMVKCVLFGEAIPATSVAIHFDDCYRDVRRFAAPLLAAARVPATAFISSGFLDTDRVFDHDRVRSPHRFENLSSEDVRELGEFGIDVGAHTVNHVDLGEVDLDQAPDEVFACRKQLEDVLGLPVKLFAFPFGGFHNICDEVRGMIQAAGYDALFSAHGGFVNRTTELFDIPRFAVSSEHSALALLMEIEGIPATIRRNRRKFWRVRFTPSPL